MAGSFTAMCFALGGAMAVVSAAQGQVREVKAAAAVTAAPVTAAPVAASPLSAPTAPPATFEKNQGKLPSIDEAQMRRQRSGPITAAEIETTRREEIGIKYIRLPLNKSQTLRLDYSFTDVLVGAAEIAEVVPISDRTLYVLGKKSGTTNISIFDANKRLIGLIDATVGPDAPILERDISESNGNRSLRVRGQGNGLVLSGMAPDAVTVDRALQVARTSYPDVPITNLTRVASPQQVMLKVRFVEVNRRAGRDFGVRWEYANRRTGVSIGREGVAENVRTTPSRGVGLITDAIPAISGAALNAAGSGQFFNLVSRLISTNSSQLDVFISALEEQGLARRLAEPNLVAMSGDRAEFLAGGEYPIPVAQSAAALGVAPTITVQYKEFGVKLSFLPTVLANDVISLQLEPEVSEIDPAVSVSVGGGVVVPGLSKRRAKTNVELRSGQSFSIAGLMQNFSSRNLEQVPWLGSVPIIGALFSSKEFQSRETELVVIVTPHIVKPAKPGQMVADPMTTTMPGNDLDFFLNNKKEIKRNMHEFTTANGVAVGPHGHMLPADFTDIAKVQGVVTPAAAQ
jgi:pilus assembly protein CpaC